MAGAWNPASPRTWTAAEVVTETMLNAEIRDRMLWLGGTDGLVTQRGNIATADAQSTTSVTQTIIPNTSVTLTTGGGDVLVWATIPATCTSTAQLCTFSLGMDATTVGLARWVFPAAAAAQTISMVYRFTSVSSAAHVFSPLWGVAGGATLATDAAIFRSLVVLEVRR